MRGRVTQTDRQTDRQSDRRLRIIQTDNSWSIISVGSGVVGRGAAKIHIWDTHRHTHKHDSSATPIGWLTSALPFVITNTFHFYTVWEWVELTCELTGDPQVWEALATNDSLRFCDFLLPWYSLTLYAFFYQETSMTSREHVRKSAEKVMRILLYHNNVRLVTLWNTLRKPK